MAGATDAWVCMADGVRAHGIRGEVRIRSLSGDVDRFAPGLPVEWRARDGATRVLTVSACRGDADRCLVQFAEIPDRNGAETLNGGRLWGPPQSDAELEPGTYFHHQLIGLSVVDEAGHPLGRLSAVIESGAHDLYEVRPPGPFPAFLVPAVGVFVQSVDLDAGRMVITPIPGLLPDGLVPTEDVPASEAPSASSATPSNPRTTSSTQPEP